MIKKILATVLIFLPLVSLAGEWSGYVGIEARVFPHSAVDAAQDNSDNWSVVAEPEYYNDWDDGWQSFTFVPFLRIDQHDSERTHFDIRELTWLKAADDWELRVGVRQVFWGVAESNHLVDIINQTDLIENIDTEDKLGQPMINFAFIKDWGTVDFFIMPGFRERTFPGIEGRLRTQPRVDTDHPVYESSAEDKHIDFAIRWSHVIGDFDIGLSHFYGTSRDPRFEFSFSGMQPILIPHYDIINQTSLDLQATKENWLWKLEMIYRSGQEDLSGDDSYFALVGGFEYTFFGVLESDIDVGIVSEYLFDDRDDNALTPFEDDIMIGVRLALNDVQSSDLLFGIIFDRDTSAKSFNLEASRRLGDSWKLEAEARFFSDIPADDWQYFFRNDDYFQFTLSRYF
ncbi:MAG: hypothetical protein AB8D52_01150 [Gammaproteobacteria bacterium]